MAVVAAASSRSRAGVGRSARRRPRGARGAPTRHLPPPRTTAPSGPLRGGPTVPPRPGLSPRVLGELLDELGVTPPATPVDASPVDGSQLTLQAGLGEVADDEATLTLSLETSPDGVYRDPGISLTP